jgi:uncharacterized membrane protein
MDKLHKVLTTDPTAAANQADTQNTSPVVNFIRFKMEPIIEYSLYTVGMLTIVIGTIVAVSTGINNWRTKKLTFDERTSLMRIQLSEAIALGLTFILGAEVVKTFRISNFMQVLRVVALVLVRQLITYFLDKDVARLRKQFPGIENK